MTNGLDTDLDWSIGLDAAAWLQRTAALVKLHLEGRSSNSSGGSGSKTAATPLSPRPRRTSPRKRDKGKGPAPAAAAAAAAITVTSKASKSAGADAGSSAGEANEGGAPAAVEVEAISTEIAARMHALADSLPNDASAAVDVIWIGSAPSPKDDNALALYGACRRLQLVNDAAFHFISYGIS
eukprot:gene15296-20818_t